MRELLLEGNCPKCPLTVIGMQSWTSTPKPGSNGARIGSAEPGAGPIQPNFGWWPPLLLHSADL
uniref:Uncharacterized protein n=1 Tax=Oryza sativa subsp. japonica TaxID=39947 RepID=Q69TP5_ORYSJ|nr:hypothetical protein [Oryza sativa Japonica Group]